jgi:hypothetical protein
MEEAIYAKSGAPVGFHDGKIIYDLQGQPVGQLCGSHAYCMGGHYVGELKNGVFVLVGCASGGSKGNPNPTLAGRLCDQG